MGRQRSARTETRILEAALKVFAAMGPDAPKIDDFAQAAGISRGTFYNHFESVEELLAATSEWTTREIVEVIEAALEGISEPGLRFGLGLRLFFSMAQQDPVWCRFVARMWKVGGLELPLRDLERGVRLGVFRAPSAAVARDFIFGGIREALLQIGEGRSSAAYGAQITELCLQALGADVLRIAAILRHPLPRVPSHPVPTRQGGVTP
ncbi:MAG: TetR/AcrR family transcriptional regulator [Deltaproteobacteria bacterium]|nr:TetR/AcrR family transcriptional regulator [Deltaproteobacteria bacterium]